MDELTRVDCGNYWEWLIGLGWILETISSKLGKGRGKCSAWAESICKGSVGGCWPRNSESESLETFHPTHHITFHGHCFRCTKAATSVWECLCFLVMGLYLN